jgi:hypothetical protein
MLAVEPKTHRRPVKSPKRVALQFKPTTAPSGKVEQTAGPEKKTFRCRPHRTQAGNSRARGKRPTPPHKARILPTSPAANSRRIMMLTKRLSTNESGDAHAVVEVLENQHQGTELTDVHFNTGIQQVKWTKMPPRSKSSPQLNRDIRWRPEPLKKNALCNRSWGTTHGSGSSKRSLSKEETSSNGNRGAACTGDVDSRKMKLTAIATGEERRPAKFSYRILLGMATCHALPVDEAVKNDIPRIENVVIKTIHRSPTRRPAHRNPLLTQSLPKGSLSEIALG